MDKLTVTMLVVIVVGALYETSASLNVLNQALNQQAARNTASLKLALTQK